MTLTPPSVSAADARCNMSLTLDEATWDACNARNQASDFSNSVSTSPRRASGSVGSNLDRRHWAIA